MKRVLFTLITLTSFLTVSGQYDGYLIVKEYSPDNWHAQYVQDGEAHVDMDDDGEYDFSYYVRQDLYAAPVVWARFGGCSHIYEGQPYYTYENTFFDIDQPFNDTSLRWEDSHEGRKIHSEVSPNGQYLDTLVYKAGIRNGEEGEYYYGWIELYSVVGDDHETVYFNLARTCFCTIPNYPLRWGQTSLTDIIEENETTAFATLHPNPTNGQVTITGQDLRSAEVFNTLGQCVATVKGEGEQMTVDISNLPAGVYFVNITDGEGRKCVRKVVKE